MPSTENFSDAMNRLEQWIQEADAIVIGAGSGLSTAAGMSYSGSRFEKNFSDFEKKYGFHDMYSGGFYPFECPEEFWAYWSRMILVNRYQDPPLPVYEDLLDVVRDKNYFVITTNVDHCFQKAGFDKKRLFYTQGDYGLFQCSLPCHEKTYDNEEIIKDMVARQKDMKIPSELIPTCPICGRPMTTNLRIDGSFVEDEGWKAASRRYHRFLEENRKKKVLYLELGVGYNTPGIIKYPFWQMTAVNPQAHLVSIGLDECHIPEEIRNRSECIQSDLWKVIQELKSKLS